MSKSLHAAGLRRSVLVVAAYRDLEAASATHVEAVGRAATQLPQCSVCPFGRDSGSEPASTARSDEGATVDEGVVDEEAAAASATAECAARIAERGADAGVLHLAMHGSGARGLVSSWRTDVVAIAEPSAHVSARRNSQAKAGRSGDWLRGLTCLPNC